MTPTTKWLLLAGVLVFGLYAADSLYRTGIEQPKKQLDSQFDELTKKLADNKNQQRFALKQGKQLDSLASHALPSDPQLARSLYQEWLLNLIATHQLTSASVDAAQPIAVEMRSRTKKGKRQRIGFRINYSLRGQARLSQLACFLNDFRKAGHLHKIRTLTMNPIGNEGRLDADVNIEVLCLEASPSKDELGCWSAVDETSYEPSTYDHLVRRNLFARGFAKALMDIQLKAITLNRSGVLEAWFRIDARGTVKPMVAQNQIPIALHDIQVLEILVDRVLVRVNHDNQWIGLGQSIGEVLALKSDSQLEVVP